MTGTTYYAMAAEAQLAEAQRTLDTHITSSATGRCLACGTFGPCYRRGTAVVIFSRSLLLPRRQPGATRPELISARRVDRGGLSLVGSDSLSGWAGEPEPIESEKRRDLL